MSSHNFEIEFRVETSFQAAIALFPQYAAHALYAKGYGMSAKKFFEWIEDQERAKTQKSTTERHLREERAESKRLRGVVKRHADERNRERSKRVGLEQTNKELAAANLSFLDEVHDLQDVVRVNRFEEKNMRRAAKVRAEETASKERQARQRVKREASRQRDVLNGRIKNLEDRLTSQAKHSGLETFMGMPIEQACEVMLAGEELARTIKGHCSWGTANEIAKRFLELRAPRSVESKKAYKSESYLCPECGGPVTKRLGPNPTYFCPTACAWEGEAS